MGTAITWGGLFSEKLKIGGRNVQTAIKIFSKFSRIVSSAAVLSSLSMSGATVGKLERSEKVAFRVETVAEGLEHPWAIVRLPDGRFLVTERAGRLRVIEDGRLLAAPVEGVPEVWAQGQGGLLDVRLHPDHAENGWIYLAFSKPFPKGALTTVIRGRLEGNRLVDVETIFDPPAEEASELGQHFGTRIVFDDAGHFFFSIGDRGGPTTPKNPAQQLGSVKGKVHRLEDDGSIPDDNPFVRTAGAKPSIWSYGHRNPQGLAIEPGTGRLLASEHGPRGGDELNLIEAGKNYGWPVVTFGINYNGEVISERTAAPGMIPPVVHWTPSPAVCGMAFYIGNVFPEWEGNLFVAALTLKQLIRLELAGGQVVHQEILLSGSGRIRDVRCFDDGSLYVVFDALGKIVRLVPEEP